MRIQTRKEAGEMKLEHGQSSSVQQRISSNSNVASPYFEKEKCAFPLAVSMLDEKSMGENRGVTG